MPLLTATEALEATDGFMLAVYGNDLFWRWKEMKEELRFRTEREYMSWMIDVAYNYYHLHNPDSRYNDDTGAHLDPGGCTNQTLELPSIASGSIVQNTMLNESHVKIEPDIDTITTNKDILIEEHDSSGGVVGVSSSDSCDMSDYYSETTRPTQPLPSVQDIHRLQMGSQTQSTDDTAISIMESSYSHSFPNLQEEDQSMDSGQLATELVRKLASSRTPRNKKVSCEHCSMLFSRKEHMRNHMVYKHGYRSKFTCPLCGKCFHAAKIVESHLTKCAASLLPLMEQESGTSILGENQPMPGNVIDIHNEGEIEGDDGSSGSIMMGEHLSQETMGSEHNQDLSEEPIHTVPITLPMDMYSSCREEIE